MEEDIREEDGFTGPFSPNPGILRAESQLLDALSISTTHPRRCPRKAMWTAQLLLHLCRAWRWAPTSPAREAGGLPGSYLLIFLSHLTPSIYIRKRLHLEKFQGQ